jgi:hypothetical protein
MIFSVFTLLNSLLDRVRAGLISCGWHLKLKKSVDILATIEFSEAAHYDATHSSIERRHQTRRLTFDQICGEASTDVSDGRTWKWVFKLQEACCVAFLLYPCALVQT